MIYDSNVLKDIFSCKKQMSPSDFAAKRVKAALQCQRLMRWDLFNDSWPWWPLELLQCSLHELRATWSTLCWCWADSSSSPDDAARLLLPALLLPPQYRCVAPPHRAWALQTQDLVHTDYIFLGVFSLKFQFLLDLVNLSIYSGGRKVYCRTMSFESWGQPSTHEAWPQPVFHHPHRCVLCWDGNNGLLHFQECPAVVNRKDSNFWVVTLVDILHRWEQPSPVTMETGDEAASSCLFFRIWGAVNAWKEDLADWGPRVTLTGAADFILK